MKKLEKHSIQLKGDERNDRERFKAARERFR